MSSTTGPAPWRGSTRRGVLIGLVAGVGGTLALALVAALVLGVFGDGRPHASTTRDIPIDGEHVSVEVTVPGDLAIDEVAANAYSDTDPECRDIRYEFGVDLTVEAFASDCAIDPVQRIMNGGHGAYRTMEDVPDPVDVEEVATGAGPARVFVQHYSEHTNVSESWEEPVAIVTLDAPVDPDFPTLVLRSDKAAFSREAFTEIVKSLDPIEYELG